MHIPSFCQAAAVGMAFYAMAAVAAPVNEPDATGIAKRIAGTSPNVDSMPDMSNAAPKSGDKDALLTTSDKNNGVTQDRSRKCRRDVDGKRRDCDYDYYDYYGDDDDYGRRGRGRGGRHGDRDGDYYNRAVQNEADKDGKDLGKRRDDDGPDGGGRRGGRGRGRGRGGRGRGGRGGDRGGDYDDRAVQNEANKDAKDLGKRGYGGDYHGYHGDDSYGHHGYDSYGHHGYDSYGNYGNYGEHGYHRN
ncbi:uncharacterized protein LY79DRAFT_656760 [Colletotrichum navitas]|uniref:Uncharacterized protein n=1 Tax=Colletotrichum navitas TaxID=681940 RepID=A0AAD8Q8T1_9PEZI|nr:uncharacterized protein LY79DRAFT_656760 [Colletotrichum navitas]KAK1597118.1 hypothetical protein LY79DRAFT_656760 [Colletotrichum navitas]